MAKIISGKDLAAAMRQEIKDNTERLREITGEQPGLAVIQVGENPASSVYVSNKKKACEQVGIKSFGYHMPEDVTQEELLELVQTLNSDDRIHGILCQLPLPRHLNEFEVLCAVSPEKDVDGFHPYNVGLLSIGRKSLVSCTPAGIVEMLERNGVEIAGKECVIVGRSNIVGKPVAQLMLSRNATVTLTHSKTKDLPGVCSRADILIVAIGRPKFVTKEFVKPGAVVIDVGINRDENGKLVGDVDFEDVFEVAGAISPVPGGVGPMTITMLLSNTLESFKHINGIS